MVSEDDRSSRVQMRDLRRRLAWGAATGRRKRERWNLWSKSGSLQLRTVPNRTWGMGRLNQQGVQGASHAANKTHQEIHTSEDAPRIHVSKC